MDEAVKSLEESIETNKPSRAKCYTNPLFQSNPGLFRMSNFILVCCEEGGEPTKVRSQVEILPGTALVLTCRVCSALP